MTYEMTMIAVVVLSLTAGAILGWMGTITAQWFMERAKIRRDHIAYLDQVADKLLADCDALAADMDANIPKLIKAAA